MFVYRPKTFSRSRYYVGLYLMGEFEAQTSLVVKLRAKGALKVDLKFRKFINFFWTN